MDDALAAIGIGRREESPDPLVTTTKTNCEDHDEKKPLLPHLDSLIQCQKSSLQRRGGGGVLSIVSGAQEENPIFFFFFLGLGFGSRFPFLWWGGR